MVGVGILSAAPLESSTKTKGLIIRHFYHFFMVCRYFSEDILVFKKSYSNSMIGQTRMRAMKIKSGLQLGLATAQNAMKVRKRAKTPVKKFEGRGRSRP
jgi:hypothetical protein